ncbi:hypothetical protein SEUCBS140593_006238 [Sporothrix eucalyptigena]|uniref:Carboxylesterase type B domain-containing protein n=1 Tax=Sporothrix eucalyptigena TaxID=1812306 RepID=A0ABP0C378_9PEZI
MRAPCVLGVGLLAGTACAAPTANVKNGTYYGVHQSTWHQDYFQGIPYAQPPVGDLRFRDPQPLNTSWTGLKNATEMGYMCYGYGATQMVNGEYVSEDCLTLNVYRASNVSANATSSSPKGLLPVVVYLHGGQFKQGSGRDPRYNMTSLLQVGVQNAQPFVGVTLNYRLSYWGFLYGNDVANANAANLGLKDQRLALRWVQENIAAFGGDPERVTLWGMEAGAFSAGLQLLAYGGRDDHLFRGAIIESGSPMLMWPSVTADEWDPLYHAILNDTGCTDAGDSLACLRGVEASALSSVFSGYSSDFTTLHRPNPVVDGDFLRDLGSQQLSSGQFVKVPILTGTTRDEGTWSDYGVKNINTTDEFEAVVEHDGLTSTASHKMAALYPDDPDQGIPATLVGRPGNETGLGAQWKRVAAYSGDKVMIAGRRMAAQTLANHGLDVYSYVYDVLFHAKWWQYGAQESDDLAFVFHNVTLSEAAISPTDAADQKPTFEPLSYLMCSMWLSFVSTLNPNNVPSAMKANVTWPKYTTQSPQNLVFDVNATALCRG